MPELDGSPAMPFLKSKNQKQHRRLQYVSKRHITLPAAYDLRPTAAAAAAAPPPPTTTTLSLLLRRVVHNVVQYHFRSSNSAARLN